MKNLKQTLTLFCVTLIFASCSTFKKMPSSAEMQAINDSIIAEGFQLYYSERANWIATDIMLERCNMANVGGSVTYQPDANTWAVVFFDRDNEIAYLRKERSLASKAARLTVVTLDGVQFHIWERELACLRRLSQMSFRPSAWDRWAYSMATTGCTR